MKYLITIEGFDPTSGPGTPTNAELLQMVRQSQFASDVGALILSDTTPDVALYPILSRFRWAKTTAGVLDGLFYYHDGSSWVLERPAPGTVDADSITDGTLPISKLAPDGDALQIIRINAGKTAFEFVALLDAIADGTLEYSKLALASGQNYLLISGLGGVWEAKTAAYVMTALIKGSTAVTTINSTADQIAYRNAADGNAYKITIADFIKDVISKLTELTTTAAADLVIVADASDSGTVKKVQIQNLLVDTGVTAATYSFPSSVTVNAKGQVTAIASASTAFLKAVGTAALPAAGAAATIPHSLSGLPSLVRVVLQCVTANNGYVANDEVDISGVGWSAANTGLPAYAVTVDATNITIGRENNTTPDNLYLHPKTGGAYFNLNTEAAKWQLKAYAKL